MMRWVADTLVIDIDEIAAPPLVGRVRGQIRLTPASVTDVELALTPDASHIWRPFAPVSRIKVDIQRRGWTWEGHGYFDANFGTRALEEDFCYWTWGRYPVTDGTACFYDATRLDGSQMVAGFRFAEDGRVEVMAMPPKRRMRHSLWAVARDTRGDADFQPHQVLNMLDAPFYSRSAVKTRIHGVETVGVHEALDLRRFRSPLIKPMLAVRVPRRRNWRFCEDS